MSLLSRFKKEANEQGDSDGEHPSDTEQDKYDNENTEQNDEDFLESQLAKVSTQADKYEEPWNKKKKKYEGPQMPEWFTRRPFLNGKLVHHFETGVPSREALSSKSLPIQEYFIIDDLLYCLVGIEGDYISTRTEKIEIKNKENNQNSQNQKDTKPNFEEKVTFILEVSMDSSLKSLIQQVLPVCSLFISLSMFVEKYSQYQYGLTFHAFCEAIKDILNDFVDVVIQMESLLKRGKLTAQKLWFYIQPSLRTLMVLTELTKKTHGTFGTQLLNVIFQHINLLSGDEYVRQLLTQVMQHSSVPFFKILEGWIFGGKIDDPFGDFFVVEKTELKKENLQRDYNDAYWEQRYTFREESFPLFISEDLCFKILTTGKHLNVIRESGLIIDNSSVAEPLFFSNEKQYQKSIEKAYFFASRHVLNLIMKDSELILRLRSLKHYFLLEQSDFFVAFLKSAEPELKQHVSQVSLSNLEGMLDVAIHSSTTKHKEEPKFVSSLCCTLLPYSLSEQLIKIIQIGTENEEQTNIHNFANSKLSGLESFAFDYKVKWPLLLVINRKSVTKYQLLFRNILLCRHLQMQLERCWFAFQELKKYGPLQTAKMYGLQAKMSHFMQNLQYYLFSEVIEPNWQILETNLNKATTVDEVLKYHGDFLDTCLKDSMLTDQNLVKIMSKLMGVSLRFVAYCLSLVQGIHMEAGNVTIRKDSNLTFRQAKSQQQKLAGEKALQITREPNVVKNLAQFETNFDSTLKLLIEALENVFTTEGNQNLANFILRLDYNNYYSQLFRK